MIFVLRAGAQEAPTTMPDDPRPEFDIKTYHRVSIGILGLDIDLTL